MPSPPTTTTLSPRVLVRVRFLLQYIFFLALLYATFFVAIDIFIYVFVFNHLFVYSRLQVTHWEICNATNASLLSEMANNGMEIFPFFAERRKLTE